MNWLDILFASLAIAGFFKGYTQGFIRQFILFIAVIVAIHSYQDTAIQLQLLIKPIQWLTKYSISIISNLLAFLIIVGIITLIGEVIHKIIDIPPLSLLNRLVGGSLGLGVALMIISFSLNLFEIIDLKSNIISRESKIESRFYFYIKKISSTITPANLFIWKE